MNTDDHRSIRKLLYYGERVLHNVLIRSSRLDAELILASILKGDRAALFAHIDDRLDIQDVKKYKRLIGRRAKHEPIAYILGEKEFYARRFYVDSHVLIPRPETEELLETVCSYLRNAYRPLNILDIGTGSGCLAVSLALEISDSMVYATDISRSALTLAQKNVKLYGLKKRIRLIHARSIPKQRKLYHCIISNPPYLSPSEYREAISLYPDIKFEPKNALIAQDHGLHELKEIITALPRVLRKDGFALFEICPQHWHKLQYFIEKQNKWTTTFLPSNARKKRLLHLTLKNA